MKSAWWKMSLPATGSPLYLGLSPKGHQNSNGTGQRKGVKTSGEELKGRALALRQQGHSYGQIAKIQGISKTLAWSLVNEPE